jgi:NTP pyrophosphatase (non-canonical NTP hydrolase)
MDFRRPRALRSVWCSSPTTSSVLAPRPCTPTPATTSPTRRSACGEAGEAAEKVKKALRDDGGVLTEERRAALGAELGDVLWYVAQLATEAGLDLDTLAEENLVKLLSRQERNVLQGSGDTR